ncbi:MAG: 50S ribosomal protein L5 [Leptospirales bacterium]|nr:50S ribosomal protein L5 [Leptospirales bacterium]
MSVLYKKYREAVAPELFKEFEYGSVMQVPRLEKITLNIGMGDAPANPKGYETAIEEMALITGQRPVKTRAKKSIAGFKLREGSAIGAKVTLRGKRMYEFLERLVFVALPRVRDFKGINPDGFDGRGNYNMSIKEQIIFPEIDVDKVDSYHGLNLTFTTTAKTDAEARSLMTRLGMPFKKK